MRSQYVIGYVTAGERKVPIVSTRLSLRDIFGALKVRVDIGRSRYSVPPGLYAVGQPTPESHVLVTANYKISFDSLRRELSGIDAWILVLDTRGVNVWCAAGKGTFGTRELLGRISEVELGQVVSHKTLILPQLGASGVSAPLVKKKAGYRVVYGPVRARDIPAFLSQGMRKDDRMRGVEFRLSDRMSIAPVELMHALPVLLVILGLSAVFALPTRGGYGNRLLAVFLPYAGAALLGTLVFPALLPYLPFKAFTLKGAVLGIPGATAASLLTRASLLGSAALILTMVPLVSFLAMNFTGSSTFTSQAGAELEVKRGVIPMAASLILGVAATVTSRMLGI